MIYISLFLLFIVVFLVRFNFFRPPKKGIIVLLYHRIDNKPTGSSLDKFSISENVFEKQMIFLKKRGFVSILPSEIERVKEDGSWKNKRYAIITFDDGYKDNLKAAEILKKHDMKGVFFISTAYIGKTLNSVNMLTDEDIKKIISLGMGIGSHSHHHEKLSKLSLSELDSEIKLSLGLLDKFCSVEDFAYPFGNYSQDVIDALKHHNIKRAYIIGQKIYEINKCEPYKIPRAIIRKDTTLLDFYLITTRGRSKF